MQLNEIKKWFEEGYEEERNKYENHFIDFYENARDKEYAVKYALAILYLPYLLRFSSTLEKEIRDSYEHTYKLGGSIESFIPTIPDIVSRYKLTKSNREIFENNSSRKIEYQKLFGIIPYKIKSITISNQVLEMKSWFEDLTSIKDISLEFGRQKAIVDLLESYKRKFIEHGGFVDQSQLIPSMPSETLLQLKESLSKCDLFTFFKTIQALLATLPYDMKITEGFFHSHIHLLLIILDFKILSEQETNIGRIDSVVETENYLYIFEFKRNDASIALEQILARKYYQKYLVTKKKIILVAVAVDTSERNIIDWEMQTFKK